MNDTNRAAMKALFDRALEASDLSQNQAAKQAGITGPRWRQIVDSKETKRGQTFVIDGPANTVARMAQAVGITARELRAVGRHDAAEYFERTRMGPPANPFRLPRYAHELTDIQRRAVIGVIQAFNLSNLERNAAERAQREQYDLAAYDDPQPMADDPDTGGNDDSA